MRSTTLLVIVLITGISGAAPGVAHAGHDSSHVADNTLRPSQPPAVVPRDRWEPGTAAAGSAAANTGQWDTTLPMVPSANVADPVAIVNSVLQVSSTSMQVTADL